MILRECYYVVYKTADYSDENKTKMHEDAYLNYTNALLVAQELTKCNDLAGEVSVIDGSTGEVLDTFDSNDATPAVEEKVEKPTTLDSNAFEDGLGGVWRKDEDEEDDLWSYDCSGISCNDCPYNLGRGPCYTDKLYIEDAMEIIDEAKMRIGK